MPIYAEQVPCDGVFPSIKYQITNGTSKSCTVNETTKSVIIDFKTKSDGLVNVKILKNSELDPCNELQVIILRDSEEADFVEKKSLLSRSFAIPFKQGNTQIEIITTYIPEEPLPKLSDCIAKKSPMPQTESGVSLEKVVCARDFVLLEKESDHSVACVTPNTAKTLIERSWGQYVYNQGAFEVVKDDKIHAIEYKIRNGVVNEISADFNSESLIVEIYASKAGTIIIKIPRGVIDARLGPDGINGEDDGFFVLVDGKEVEFTEKKYDAFRELTIPFEDNSKEIEIIGTNLISQGS